MGSQLDPQQVVEGCLQVGRVHLRPAETCRSADLRSESFYLARSERVSYLSKSLHGSVFCLPGSAPTWLAPELLMLLDFKRRWTPGNVLSKEEKKKRSGFSLQKEVSVRKSNIGYSPCYCPRVQLYLCRCACVPLR